MTQEQYSWIVQVGKEFFQVDGASCEVTTTGALTFHSKAGYLVTAFPTWDSVNIMSQLHGFQNGRNLLSPAPAALKRER